MHHVAIMKKSWGLILKIITGEKTIESRWYKTRHVPWGKIEKGDTVFFKNSGEPISISAKVSQVVSFENLEPEKVREILNKHGDEDGISKKDISKYYDLFKDKKYCLLIFLEDVQKIKPFNIDKRGFGMQSAWITMQNIAKIKK